MKKFFILSLFIMFAGYGVSKSSNVFIQGAFNRNYVFGLYSSGFIPVNGYSFGAGYGFFFDHRYAFSTSMNFQNTGFLEEYEFHMNNVENLYSSRAKFSRLSVPALFQIHYPRFFIETGPGFSVLLFRNQTETYTYGINSLNPRVFSSQNPYEYPAVELFFHIGAGIRLSPNLDLKFNLYQGINDLSGESKYSWQKNTRFGVGLAFNLSRRNAIPEFSKENMMTRTPKGQEATAAYRIHYVNNIIRYNFQHVGDHPDLIQIRIRDTGSGANMPQSINLETSSGNINISQSTVEINNVTFPLIGSLTYFVMNASGSGAFECNMNFEITKLGNWIISLQN